MKNDFKILDEISHTLQRPSMYIGSIDPTERTSYTYNGTGFEYTTYQCIPGLIKIIDEIIDNAVDVAIRTKFKCNKIKVKVTDEQIIVEDNGTGIPVELHADTNKYLPEIAWTTMRAGTSFNDDRETIGANGLGSVACNIFSKNFVGISDDGKKRFVLKCKNNLSDISHTIKESNSPGVTVKFKPDLNRFNLTIIDDTHKMLVYQRLINLAISYPEISFSFNGKKININAKKFVKMFSDGKESAVETDKCIIGVLPNDYDDFKFYTYVNGISMPNGGNHVDYVSSYIVNGIRERLIKKHKTIKPGDIKNKLQLILFLKHFPNPKFASQTKDALTNSVPEFKTFIDANLDKLIKQILKNDDIIEPIVEMFKLKEELKAKRDLKGLSKKKKIKSDKYISPIKQNNSLFLCEGLSAMGGVSAILGREQYGYYAMKGVPLNTYDCAIQKITANAEIKDIVNILDLELHTDVDKLKSINFERIIFATDADADGSHITGLLLGLFYKFAPNLFKEKKIYRLKTPIIIAMKKGVIVEHFFTLDVYEEWIANNSVKGLDFKYAKGLGSWKSDDLSFLINKYGINTFLEYFTVDDAEVIDIWLSGKRANDRKEKIKNFVLDINMI